MTWVLALALSSVQVSVEQCGALDAVEVQRIVEVELAAAPATDEPIRARLRCVEGAVDTEVADPVTQKVLSRRVTLGRLPARGHPRALALAIAELISASWSELLLVRQAARADEAEHQNASPQVAAQAIATLPAVAPRGTLRLEALGVSRALPGDAALQWGAGLRFIWASESRLGLLVDAVVEHGQARRAMGTVTIDSVTAAAGPLLAFSPLGWLQLHLGAGARFGVGRIIGVPDDGALVAGSTLTGAWGGPFATGGLGFLLGPVALGLWLEGGVALARLTANADGARVAGLDGGWLGFGVSAGWNR